MKSCIGVLLAGLLALPVQAAVKDSSPAGFTIENAQDVPASVQDTWDALVDDVGQWWPADHTWWGDASNLSIRARAGGCFCERHGAQQARHMTVTFVDPGRTLRLVGGLGPLQGMGLDGVLEFRLAADDTGGTRVTMWYRAGGYTPDDLSKLAPMVDQVMAGQLAGLGKLLRARAAPVSEER